MAIKPSAPSVAFDVAGLDAPTEAEEMLFRADADKACGKTSNLISIPKRAGTRHYYLSADTNTRPGLRKFFLEGGGLGGEAIPGMTGKDIDEDIKAVDAYIDQHAVIMNITQGYSKIRLSSTVTAKDFALRCFARTLADAEAGKVASVFVQHYQEMYELSMDLCRYLAKPTIGVGGKIPITQYEPRTTFLNLVDAHILEMPSMCDSVWLVDYGEEPKEVINPDTLEVSIEQVGPKWTKKRQHLKKEIRARFLFQKTTTERELGNGSKRSDNKFTAVVHDSQHVRFRTGEAKDITGKGMAAFFDQPWWHKWLEARGQKAETQAVPA